MRIERKYYFKRSDLTLLLHDLKIICDNINRYKAAIYKLQEQGGLTGQEITIDLATIIPNSNNNISMTGIQANVIPTDLRFWDPITDDNTETWTNI